MLDEASYAVLASMPVRPEYLLPVLQSESGLNPAVQNQAGYPYYGIGQDSADILASHGIDPTDYLTWPASKQLETVVKPYMQGIIDRYGPLNSGARCYQANFLPATLATATSLDSVIATQGSDVYAANAGFDTAHAGVITVQDLADFVAKAASTQAVQDAIAKTYAISGGSPNDPVYGTDFGKLSTFSTVALVAAIVSASYLGAKYLAAPRSRRRQLRWLTA
jgi:hypothetical protein